MKNKQFIFNWLFIICFLPIANLVQANSIEETIVTEKSYVVNSDSKLEIFNKYGAVHVNTWESDSVMIKVTQKFEASDRKQLDRLKNMLTLTITKTKFIVLVKSEYNDPGKNILSMLPLDISSSNNALIDIEVWMPMYLNITIEHRYGDVFLGNVSGDAYIDVAHGQFEAQDFYGSLTLNANYCNSSLGYVNQASISAKFSDLSIDTINVCHIESRSADVIIGHANNLTIDGRNDNFLVGSCDELNLGGYFSKARFEIIYGNVTSKTSYGNLNMGFPKGYDSHISIRSNYTDLALSFKDNSGHYPVEVLHQKSRIMYSASNTKLKEDKISAKDVIYKTTGTLGSGKLLDGGLDVEMFSGELKLIVE